MADQILYDYQAMDNAYEQMKSISNKISGECENMSQDALRLLETIEGNYAGAYHDKVIQLNERVAELNEEMNQRAGQLQEQFNIMGQTDVKLGDGF